jgi:hypothetical protein
MMPRRTCCGESPRCFSDENTPRQASLVPPMILLMGLAALDLDFKGLAAYACQDGPNQATLNGNQINGYRYCSSDSSGRLIDANTMVCGEILKRWR